MAAIECNEIQQTINQLLATWGDNCKVIKPSDLALLVELVAAVRQCNEGGPNYDTLVAEFYNPPVTDEVVTYPIDTFHSLNIMVQSGSIERTVGGDTVTISEGSVLRHTVTTLNQSAYTFTVKGGSEVYVEYLIETV